MKAMIMAAGLGTRLGDITKTIPKALIDINGRTILEHIIRKLYLSKFDDIIINVHLSIVVFYPRLPDRIHV